MTENEKKLLKSNNKRKIKKANNMDTDKEELEMIEAVLNSAKENTTEKEMNKYNQKREETVLKYSEKNNIAMSDVPEFKIQQLWNILNKEIPILKKDFNILEKQNFKNKANFENFRHYAEDISYIIDELGLTFRMLATKKAKKENYNDIIPEHVYNDLDINNLFLEHSFYDCDNLKDYIISAKESFELLSYIEKYIKDIISDKTKEKCTTGANILMTISVEIEGLYVCHFEKIKKKKDQL